MDISDSTIDSGRPDLVPMIDCIMLLLLFFMMTTKFTAEEQTLAAVLAPNGTGTFKTIEPPPVIRVVAYPAGARLDSDLATLERLAHENPTTIDLRVGNREPLRVEVSSLRQAAGIERVHAWIRDGLAPYEQASLTRAAQPEVSIACFSGLPWAVALATYDAVRGYELSKVTGKPDLALARNVTFVPPTVRDHEPHARAMELLGILRMQ